MMRNCFYLAICLVLSTPLPAAAALINGDFETGDLTGWAALGGASAVTGAGGVPALEGVYSAQLPSDGDNLVSAAEMESFLGLTPNSISDAPLTDPAPEAFGVVIKQEVEVVSGDILTFSWNVPYLEAGGINDSTFFATTDNGGAIVELIDGVTAAADDDFATTFESAYTFTTGGVHTIGFGLVNGADSCCGTETLLVDRVSLDSQVTNVPAPATLALMGLGLLGLRLRRKPQAASRKVVGNSSLDRYGSSRDSCQSVRCFNG